MLFSLLAPFSFISRDIKPKAYEWSIRDSKPKHIVHNSNCNRVPDILAISTLINNDNGIRIKLLTFLKMNFKVHSYRNDFSIWSANGLHSFLFQIQYFLFQPYSRLFPIYSWLTSFCVVCKARYRYLYLYMSLSLRIDSPQSDYYAECSYNHGTVFLFFIYIYYEETRVF